MAYSPNILNQFEFETYVYNIKISMVDPLNFSKEKFIAENSTDATLNINSVTQTLVLGQSVARNSFANQFDIIIHEPNNVRFFEKIVKSAGELGIKNHVNATYKIEISFPGRISTGQPKKYPETKPFTYYVKFIKVDATITDRGAEYIINAVETNSKGYSYINNDTKSTLTYKASSVNEALTEFEKVLNEAAKIQNETNINSLNPDEYKILLADDTQDWGNWKIEITENTPNVEGDKLLFHITSGTKVIDHIGNILKATREYKEYPLVSGGFAKPLDQETTDDGSIGLKYGYKVIPIVKEKEFDPLRGDYTKEITFIIKKHIIPEENIDSNELSSSITNRQNQLKILKEYFDTGLLTKKYDYLYTGNNTEVIKFDMKLQYAYYLISPVFGGQVSQSNLREAREISEKVKSTKSAKSKYVQAKKNYEESTRTRSGFGEQFEDVLNSTRDEFTKSADELWDSVKNTPIPNYQTDIVDNSYSYVSENDEEAVALARFGSVQANVETSADLMEIELGIRGDPYWLGNPTGDEDFSENTAPYTIGGPMFFLNINLPVPEDSSGLRTPSTEYYISGVYKVISVISEFRNGQFIQYLKAIRMVKVLTDVVADNLKKGSVGGSSTGGISAVTSGSSSGNATENSQTRSNTPRSPTITPRTSNPSNDNIIESDVPQEQQNSPVNVARQATQENVINLNTTNVIGIYGDSSKISALIKYPSGVIEKKTVGDTVNGSRITSINNTTITFESGRTLELPPE